MKKFAAFAVAAALLSGCRKEDEALTMAADAFALAQHADVALSNGSESETAMGMELAEARANAAEAKESADQLRLDLAHTQARLGALESRLDGICARAPAACY